MMIFLRRAIPLFFIVVAIATGCAKPAPEFSSYVKPEVEFAKFRTYHWQELRPETPLVQARTDLMHRLVVQTIEEELASDGLEKTERGDLSVTYRVTVSPQKSFWQTLFAAESVTPGTYNQRSAEAQQGAAEEHKLHQGVLVIELRSRSGDIVWSGRASIVAAKGKPGMAVEAVRRILEDYPPAL